MLCLKWWMALGLLAQVGSGSHWAGARPCTGGVNKQRHGVSLSVAHQGHAQVVKCLECLCN